MDSEEEDELELEENEKVVVVPQINYQVLVFSLAELAKPISRREPKARMLMVSSDMEWIDVYALLKVKAVDILFPGQDVVHNDALEITFTIPRIVKVPLPLLSASDYKYLVKNTVSMKTPAANIVIKQVTAIDNEVRLIT